MNRTAPTKEKRSVRDAFGEAIIELGENHPEIVVLTADLSESTRVMTFEKKFPERFVQVGVAEQNMSGIAAGMALSGKVPFMTSFSTFSPGGNLAQIRTTISYSNANVKIIGTHAGLSASADGATHQALEDIGIMRMLPNITIICPSDYNETKKAVYAAYKHKGPVYIRLTRDATNSVTEENAGFDIGQPYVLKEGKDVTIIFSGTIGAEVMEAVEELEKQNVSCEVISCPTIKPFEHEQIVASVKKTKNGVTVEEHQKAGGLGGLISEILSENYPTKLKRIGVDDSFGESGTYVELKQKHGLDAKSIEYQVKEHLGR